MRFKFLPVVLVSALLFVPVMLTIPVGVRADFGYFNMDYPMGNSTFWGAFRVIEEYPSGGTTGYECIAGWGGPMGNLNPDNVNYGLRSFMVTSHYNIFDYPWNYVYDPYTDTYHQMYAPDPNATVISVYAVVIGYNKMNQGWFSVRYNETVSWVDATPWTPYGAHTYTSQAGYNSFGWSNSTMYPYTVHNSTSWFIQHEWDITSLYSWNISMLTTCQYPDTSKGLNIMWTTKENSSSMVYSYLGIRYVAYGYYESGRPSGWETPDVTVAKNLSGLIWLLVLFAPAMAMGETIPKLGFVAGAAIMLVVLGFSQTNFMPVTIVGFLGLAVLMYKGD